MVANIALGFCLVLSCARPSVPGPDNEWHYQQVKVMDRSIRQICGQAILPSPTASAAHAINLASSELLVIAAHDVSNPPRMVYATQAALDLWEMDWGEFVSKSWGELLADPGKAQSSIFESPAGWGSKFGCDGTFLSSGGRKFALGDAMVWDVHGDGDGDGDQGQVVGQAVMLRASDVQKLDGWGEGDGFGGEAQPAGMPF